jgi:hypothetical protein
MAKKLKLLGVMAIVFFVAIAYGKDKVAKNEVESLFLVSGGFEEEGISVESSEEGSYFIKATGEIKFLGAIRRENPETKFTVDIDDKSDFKEGNNSLKVTMKKLDTGNKVVMSLQQLDSAKISSGEEYTVEIWAKASQDDAQASLFFEGQTNEGHYWKLSSITVGKKWKKYTFAQVMPEKIKNMWLRFDFKTECTYWVDGYKFYKEP